MCLLGPFLLAWSHILLFWKYILYREKQFVALYKNLSGNVHIRYVCIICCTYVHVFLLVVNNKLFSWFECIARYAQSYCINLLKSLAKFFQLSLLNALIWKSLTHFILWALCPFTRVNRAAKTAFTVKQMTNTTITRQMLTASGGEPENASMHAPTQW